jgi:hypothetical protein
VTQAPLLAFDMNSTDTLDGLGLGRKNDAGDLFGVTLIE